MASAQRLVRSITTFTRANNLFDRYKREAPQVVREAKVEENKAVQKLKKAWEIASNKYGVDRTSFYRTTKSILNSAHAVIKDLKYSAKDVEMFSLALAEFQDEEYFAERAGIFLSVLINNGQDESYLVHTFHLGQEIEHFGYENKKNVIVNGDGGRNSFKEMKSGAVTINGNGGWHVGDAMSGGTLIIKGDADEGVAYLMSGGRITVEGNASIAAGAHMSGGVLIVRGDIGYESGACMTGGRIEVYGNADQLIGYAATGGEIHLHGLYRSISPHPFEGNVKIFHKEKLIHPRVENVS